MRASWFSFNANGNWIDIEREISWLRPNVIVMYNDNPIVTEKLEFLWSSKNLEFDVIEEDAIVHYLIEIVRMTGMIDMSLFNVFRDGEPIIVSMGDRKRLCKTATPD